MTGFSAIPLADDAAEHEEDSRLSGVSKILGPKLLQLPAITIGLLGVQVLWSVEIAYGQPYLISLGLSKSAVSMVFLAGPISGLVVQPVIGVLADNSKSRFGRRRPYMLLGVIISSFSMLLLGFTRPIASLFTSPGSLAYHLLAIWLAIFALFSVDFSINAVQAVDRALLVDVLPTSKQPDGNAWAARMLGIGSVAGYFVGNLDMTKILPFLGNTEIEVLAVERVVVATVGKAEKSMLKELKEIWDSARTLPPVIRQICIIQFFAWIGWFPVLFNTTEYIAEIYKRSVGDSGDPEEIIAEGTRLGTRAMFFHAIISLACNIILPFFVSEAGSSKSIQHSIALGSKKKWWMKVYDMLKLHLATLWALSHLVFAICMLASFFYSGVFGATFFTSLAGFSWAIAQWAPFALLAEAILSESVASEDTNSITLDDRRSPIGEGSGDHERQYLVANMEDREHEDLEDDVQSFRSSVSMDNDEQGVAVVEGQQRLGLMNNNAARASHLNVNIDPESIPIVHRKHKQGLAAKAGIIIGIHNIFVVMPQFVMSGISSVIFALVEPKEPISDPTTPSPEPSAGELRLREGPQGGGPNSYAIVFRLGGIAAIVAFILTLRLLRELKNR
ncbi:MFS transporter superfamily protein [Abortiporus biennis]